MSAGEQARGRVIYSRVAVEMGVLLSPSRGLKNQEETAAVVPASGAILLPRLCSVIRLRSPWSGNAFPGSGRLKWPSHRNQQGCTAAKYRSVVDFKTARSRVRSRHRVRECDPWDREKSWPLLHKAAGKKDKKVLQIPECGRFGPKMPWPCCTKMPCRRLRWPASRTLPRSGNTPAGTRQKPG